MRHVWIVIWLLVVGVTQAAPPRKPTAKPAEASPAVATDQLAAKLGPMLAILNGEVDRFEVVVNVNGIAPLNGPVALTVRRFDDQTMLLILQGRSDFVRVERSAHRTAMVLPNRSTMLVGEGDVPEEDSLAPAGLTQRLLSPDTQVSAIAAQARGAQPRVFADTLAALTNLRSENGKVWSGRFSGDEDLIVRDGYVRYQKLNHVSAEASFRELPADAAFERMEADRYTVHKVNRRELERLIVRGVRRTLEVYLPSAELKRPREREAATEHGKLAWVGGQRVAVLWGTPAQIGEAHGKLLATEARRCLDSSLYMVGLGSTARRGSFFLDELRDAYRRVEPHLPADHKAELDALAAAMNAEPEELRLASVFPERFHCSGFAVFGDATANGAVGGKLLHGRVLDYMTQIGLQDAATVFVIMPSPESGKHPFVSVGYAGFTGVVSGMNDQQISLGEMGGRGEGQWDGVPMGTLMRRALEECDTLDEVKKLWSDSPRTCEYFYVFADGKIPSAVGVAATPRAIEFIEPGQTHARLGEGVPDALLLSADDRLATLRKRVLDGYGRIGPDEALALMDRPVAMKSNLHNVLFEPQDLVLYVSHASRDKIAAERPYVRLELRELMKLAE